MKPLTELADRFEVSDEPFARGGMGEIWLAHDRHLQRQVAVKALRPEFLHDPLANDYLTRETRILAELEHPGICPLFDRFLDTFPPCYTMKLLRGHSLETRIQQLHAAAGPTPNWRPFIRILSRICDTISFAHSHGIIHRDLKPENVLVGNFGEVFVLDWGIAKRRPDRATQSRTKSSMRGPTVSDMHMGTPAYMSPEQARGSMQSIDERTDVFGLGGMLYAILTGEAPFTAPDLHSVMHLALACDFPPPQRRARRKNIPDPLNAITLKAMAADSADRYASVAELQRDLEAFLADERVTACRDSLAVEILRAARKRPRMAVSAAIVVVFAAIVAAVIVGTACFG